MVKFTITEKEENMRFDLCVVGQYPEFSRTFVVKAIEAGTILLDGKKVTKHARVAIGNEVTLDDALFVPLEETAWLNVENGVEGAADEDTATDNDGVPAPAFIPDPTILFEDENFLVINKPAGMITHPASSQDTTPSVAAWFVRHMGGLEKVVGLGDGEMRPGIVHRLDKSVSGVLVIAKTPEVFESLKAQFAGRTVRKQYRAVVYGVPAQTTGDIRFAISRSKSHPGKMAARPQHEAGRDAWTEYTMLHEVNGRYSVLDIRIHTGRTHQIRAHMAAFDHPIVGDTLYTSRRYPIFQKDKGLFLHARSLEFTHPITAESVSFEAPIPERFSLFDLKEPEIKSVG